jgi:hypothetical protein
VESTECHVRSTQLEKLRSWPSFFIWLKCKLLSETTGLFHSQVKSELDGDARLVRESQSQTCDPIATEHGCAATC